MGGESSRFLIVPPFPRPFSYSVTGFEHVKHNHFHAAQEKHWQRILDEHSKSSDATQKFSEECMAEYLQRWPQWSETDIMSLRDQFMAFDVNCDGLIDYNEMNNVLDSIGDKTAPELRLEYFKLLDADNSEGIDFEEFLQVIHLHSDKNSSEQAEERYGTCGFEKLYEESTRRKTGCNRLSITQQVNAALI